jgi:hypothetical protein
MEILTNAPARIPLRATISCALNVGGRIGGSFSLDTNFESVGFYGGVAPTSGTIRWSDGQTTSFSGTAEVAFITLELTVSATTSGAWGGGSFSFKSPMHAVTQRIGDKDMVVSVTGMQGRFNWP